MLASSREDEDKDIKDTKDLKDESRAGFLESFLSLVLDVLTVL